MSNLHEGPEWNNTGKLKKNEGSLAELAKILEIENHPEKQLSDLQRTIVENNRKKADNSLAELETILHLSEATTDKNDSEWIKNPEQTNYDQIQTVVSSRPHPTLSTALALCQNFRSTPTHFSPFHALS